jgi:hypothetical protein
VSATVRLRATLTVEYDADPDDYGTADPVEMAAIDAENYQRHPDILADFFVDDDIRVTVQPV